MNITFSIALDKRKQSDSGSYPVALRIREPNRPYKYIRLGFSLDEETFANVNQVNVRGQDRRDIKAKLEGYLERAEQVRERMRKWNYNLFRDRFKDADTDETEIFARYRRWIKDLDRAGKIGNKKNIENSYAQIKKFHGKETLHFRDVTVQWCRDFEKWYTGRGYKKRTAGIRLQTLRTIFSDAMYEGVITWTPFNRRGYSIPTSKKKSRALSLNDTGRIWNYRTTNTFEQEAVLYFKLIYLLGGINLHDLFSLTWDQIHNGILSYARGKTIEKSNRTIEVFMTDDIMDLFLSLSTTSDTRKGYILPIYEGSTDTAHRDRLKRNKTYTLNKWWKQIGKRLLIQIPVTSYVIRHTYVTIAKNKGIPISFIADQAGHSNTKTTETFYAGNYEREQAEEYQKIITNFNNQSGERAQDS